MNLYDKVFPPKVIVLPNGKNVTKPRSRAPLAAAVLLALTVLSVKVTGFDMSLLARRIKEFFVILGQMMEISDIFHRFYFMNNLYYRDKRAKITNRHNCSQGT